jgi:hypothetical protein
MEAALPVVGQSATCYRCAGRPGGMSMRPIIIAVALLAAHPERAELPFPEIERGLVCERRAESASKKVQDVLGGDFEKLKETARAGCLKTQEAIRQQARTMWDKAPDALRRNCKGEASYPALALCLLQGDR